jgi:hypothetical protein
MDCYVVGEFWNIEVNNWTFGRLGYCWVGEKKGSLRLELDIRPARIARDQGCCLRVGAGFSFCWRHFRTIGFNE